jgi:hypothetical protein
MGVRLASTADEQGRYSPYFRHNKERDIMNKSRVPVTRELTILERNRIGKALNRLCVGRHRTGQLWHYVEGIANLDERLDIKYYMYPENNNFYLKGIEGKVKRVFVQDESIMVQAEDRLYLIVDQDKPMTIDSLNNAYEVGFAPLG